MKRVCFCLLFITGALHCFSQSTNGSSANNSYNSSWFLGWNESNSLLLKTDGTERIKIFDNLTNPYNKGFVGLGDFSNEEPTSLFHLYKSAKTAPPVYQLFNNSATGFGNKSGFLQGLGGKFNTDAVLASQSGSIQFYTHCCIIGEIGAPVTSPYPPDPSNGNLRMVIKSSTGNVGIAVENPAARFQINEGVAKIGMGEIPNNDAFAVNYIGFNAVRNKSTMRWNFDCDTRNNGGVVMSSTAWGAFRISTIKTGSGDKGGCSEAQNLKDKDVLQDNVRFEITQDGQVLINKPAIPAESNTSDLKLLVKGGILCERVKVALESTSNWVWPDYVFEPGYKLMPLTEIERFIKTNNHLPGIPSAMEIKDKGIDLAEMNAKLLQKIEELTLHIIAQGEQIENLKKTININQ